MENNQEQAQQPERQGLQKPIPAIFKGVASAGQQVYAQGEADALSEQAKSPWGKLAGIKNKLFSKNRTAPSVGNSTQKGKAPVSFFKNPVFLLIICVIAMIAVTLFALQSSSELKKEKGYRQMLNAQLAELLAKRKDTQAQDGLGTALLPGQEDSESAGTAASQALIAKPVEVKQIIPEKTAEPQPVPISSNESAVITQLEQEKKNLTEQLSQIKTASEKLTQEFSFVQQDNASLKQELNVLKQNQVLIEEKLKLFKEVNLTPEQDTKATGTLEAKVLVVEQAQGLVVIDAGELNGVIPREEFDIYREKNLYARIKIDQIQETVAVGRIMPGIGVGRVEEGMQAKRRLK